MPVTNFADTEAQGKDDIIATIREQFAITNDKIEMVQSTIDEKIVGIKSDITAHSERIAQLENYSADDSRRIDTISIQMEIFKQDRLRNNLRLTGLPPQAFENTADTVMRIIDILNIQLLPSDCVTYSDRNKSSIIIQFDNHAYKRYFMDSMRKKTELLVEEILDVRSNSKVYCNDQLTPYFASLFQKAWQAKKNKLIHSASSLGGRIKVKKSENSQFITVDSETQLNEVIDNAETVEMSNQPSNELPNSIQTDETEDINSHKKSAKTANGRNIHRASSHTEPDRQHTNRFSAQAVPATNVKNTNRNQQWQRMRQKQNNQYEQPRYGHRYQQQDKGRNIELSPRQYSNNNRPRVSTQEPQPTRKNNNSRNYSYRHAHEHY